MEQWPFLWRLGWGCVLVLPYAAPALAQTSPCDFVNFAIFFFFGLKGRFVEPRCTLMSICYDFLFGD